MLSNILNVAMFTLALVTVVTSQGIKLCSKKQTDVTTATCKCNESTTHFETEYFYESRPYLADVHHFILSDCDSANLHTLTFYGANNILSVTVQRVKNLTFDAILPKTVKTILLKDIATIDKMEMIIFNEIPNITEIEIDTVVIRTIEPNTFNSIPISRMIFVNVTFLDLPSESLAFTIDDNPKSEITFNSCTFNNVEINPFAMSTNFANVEFLGNVVDCKVVGNQVEWIAKLFENDWEENGKNQYCDTLSSNYCDGKLGFDDQIINHLFGGSHVDSTAKTACPKLFQEYGNHTRTKSSGKNSTHSINYGNNLLMICLFLYFLSVL